MSKRSGKTLSILLVIILIGLLLTSASYAIVTGRDVRLGNHAIITISGEEIVELPCGAASHPEWRSNDPVLPETRGIPFNYHYWNPCEGNKILRQGFLLDWGFWILVSGCAYFVYNSYRRKSAKSVH